MQQKDRSNETETQMTGKARRSNRAIAPERVIRLFKKTDGGWRGGIAMIEMAIVLPVLLFLAMGMVEFGQYMYISHIIDLACRDAARAAIPQTAVAGDPAAAATRTLNQVSIPYSSVTLLIQDVSNGWATVTDCSTVPAGHNLYVYMTATYSQLPNVYRPFNDMTGHGISNSKVITSSCTMTKE